MKKIAFSLTTLSVLFAASSKYWLEVNPENISRGIAQVHEETQTLGARARSLSELKIEIDQLEKTIFKKMDEQSAILKRFELEAFTEQEVFDLDIKEEKLALEIKEMKNQLADLHEKYEVEIAALDALENQIACQQKAKNSDLESQLAKLLEDKEVVTNKILSVAEKKDSLDKEIDELKEIVSDKKKAPVASVQATQENQDITAALAALTSLIQNMQFSFQAQIQQMWMMPFSGQAFQNNGIPQMSPYLFMQQQQQQQMLFNPTPYSYTSPVTTMNAYYGSVQTQQANRGPSAAQVPQQQAQLQLAPAVQTQNPQFFSF